VPRPPGPRRNTLAVEAPGDAVEAQALVPERPHALHGPLFALVIPEGLASLTAALSSPFLGLRREKSILILKNLYHCYVINNLVVSRSFNSKAASFLPNSAFAEQGAHVLRMSK